MKGLEIREVNHSELNAEFRLDAEYFSKTYIERRTVLERFGTIEVGDCVTDGIHTSIDYDDSSNVNLVSATSPRENYFDLSRNAKMSVQAHRANPRTALRIGDVILSTVGTIGNAAVVEDDILPANSDRHVAIIRKPDFSPYALSTFLLSKYGRGQTDRECTGNVQLNLFLYKVSELRLPKFSSAFQSHIEDCVKGAYALRRDATRIYGEGERDLLSELGFEGWEPPSKTVAVRKYSDFMSAARFDAEYFQPKYDDLLKRLKNVKVRRLGGKDGLTTFYKSVEPGSECYGDEGVPFVRIADFSEFGIESVGVCIPPESCAECRRPKKDTILLSKDGSVGIAYKAEEDLDVVTSGGILHLTVCDDSVLPDYLTLVLNSKIVRMQAERDAGGSIIQHWKPSEIANVVIPILPMQQQKAIVEKVQSSFAARKESKRLLELAKRAVEVAIESGEEMGLRLLG